MWRTDRWQTSPVTQRLSAKTLKCALWHYDFCNCKEFWPKMARILSNEVSCMRQRMLHDGAEIWILSVQVVKTIFYVQAQRVSKILFSGKLNSYLQTVMFFFRQSDCLHKQPGKSGKWRHQYPENIEICHLGPGCSFVWILQVAYFQKKTLTSI